ncbi:MAG: septum formation initiator family protein [Actinomycetaceae bacterium]|nr:septum formation initiator family protein [Actinomycetaceae bacterium]
MSSRRPPRAKTRRNQPPQRGKQRVLLPGGKENAKNPSGPKAQVGAKNEGKAPTPRLRPGGERGARPKNRQTREASTGVSNEPSVANYPKTLIVTLVLALAVLGMIQPVHAYWAQQREYRAIKAKIVAAQERNSELKIQLDRWASKEYVASQARARLQMVMPGETQFSVVDPGDHAVDESKYQPTKPGGPMRPWYLVIADSVDAADDPNPFEVLTPTINPSN